MLINSFCLCVTGLRE